jgi:hypothetical protein
MEIKILGMSFRLELLIIGALIAYILAGHLLCSCSRISLKEGMGLLKDAGAKLGYKMGDGVASSWENKKLDGDSHMKKLETHAGGKVPMDEGKMHIFAENKFEPECCPSNYSSSTGCACISAEQMKHLNQRGGNRTMGPSEF